MNTYEQEIYKYFTEESNFRNMLKVASHAGSVKSRLLQEFWNELQETLKGKTEETDGEWEVSAYGSISHNWGKILIHKRNHTARGEDNLPIIAVGIERIVDGQFPFYGIFLNNKVKNRDVQEMIRYIRDIPALKSFDQDGSQWWPKWNPSGLNFRNDDDYVKILPAHRKITVDAIADTLYHLAVKLDLELDRIYEMEKVGGETLAT